ncbi:MAG: LuxR C-terminal-related transcriptional regulator, partial [Desulfobacteraceae bacterium]
MRSTSPETRIQELETELAELRTRLDSEQACRLESESRIRKSRDEWERTFEAIEDYVTILDAEKRIVRMNRAIRCAFGSQQPQETVGRYCYDVFWQRRTPCNRCPAILVQQDFGPHTAEFENRRMGKYFLVSASPIFNDGGRLEGFVHVTKDITLQKNAEKKLIEAYDSLERKVRERTAELALKSSNLEEANTALRLMLKAREEDRRELETRMLSSVHKLVRPYLDCLRQGHLTTVQKEYVAVLESNIEQIMSPFASTLSSPSLNLTPREIQIANLIKSGRTTKEMAGLLNISARAVEFHRENIREKLGLKNQKANLRSHLLSFH